MSLTLDPDAKASTRTPSYLGSKVHPAPVGMLVPIEAIMGVMRVSGSDEREPGTGNGEPWPFTDSLFPVPAAPPPARRLPVPAFRFECQTLDRPSRISSIVRPVVT